MDMWYKETCGTCKWYRKKELSPQEVSGKDGDEPCDGKCFSPIVIRNNRNGQGMLVGSSMEACTGWKAK